MTNSFETPPQLYKTDGNARRCGRVRCQWTDCDLGEVLDISASGMRIASRRKVTADKGAKLSANIEGLDGSFDVTGRLIWKRKVGFFRWEMGIEFDDLDPAARKGLALLARSAMTNEAFAIQDHPRKSA